MLFRLSEAEASRLPLRVNAFGEQLSSPFLPRRALAMTCCGSPCRTSQGHGHISWALHAPPAPWSCRLNAYRTW